MAENSPPRPSGEIRVPSIRELVEVAKKGDLEGVLEGLSERLRANLRQKYLKAVYGFDFLTEHPKRALGEAEWAGVAKAGISHETPDWFAQALIDLAKEKHGNGN